MYYFINIFLVLFNCKFNFSNQNFLFDKISNKKTIYDI